MGQGSQGTTQEQPELNLRSRASQKLLTIWGSEWSFSHDPQQIIWPPHMVRNHQDGYPYLNLSSKLCLQKYPDTSICLVKLIGQ